MSTPRVNRGKGPKGKLTESTYRKKALPHLREAFQDRCAYCLEFLPDTQHKNQHHIDHFDAHISGRKKNRYSNLMLACSACNEFKRAKKVSDPECPERRLLNCTVENEFPEHIVENAGCEWEPKTPAGDYHIRALDLNENSHIKRRQKRKLMFEKLNELDTTCIVYAGGIHPKALESIKQSIQDLRQTLNICIPFPLEAGLFQPSYPLAQ